MNNKLTSVMVDLLNYKIKEQGSNFKYIIDFNDGDSTVYKLIIQDKFIDNEYAPIPNVTKEFEIFVREFFKQYGVTNTGYSNTVKTITAWE